MKNSPKLPLVSLGVDIVNIPRFQSLLESGTFSNSVFSPNEMRLPIESLAGNFAIKESFIKAFKGEVPPFDFDTLEVLRDLSGAPMLRTSNPSLLRYVSKVIALSMSHDIDYCVGIVLVQ
jgi:holo-[acyl-carrier protein] synthase